MFLSIIIPVYNAEKYLRPCLDSCLDQDISVGDYEILCINDGSRDGSAAILDDYASRFPNIRVFHKENGGVSSARNLGIEQARGHYIWFVDADDFVAGDILGLLQKTAAETNCDRLTFPCYEFHNELSAEELRACRDRSLTLRHDYRDSAVWACLFRRQSLLDTGLRFQEKEKQPLDHTNLVYGEDTFFVYLFLRNHPAQAHITDRPIYFYRRNPDSVTMDFSPQAQRAKMNSYIQMTIHIKEDYDAIRTASGAVSSQVADQLMIFLRKALEILAQMPRDVFRETLDWMKSENLYPFRQPPECTYTWQECANEPSGTGKLRNICRYYSIHPLGLFLAALPYRIQWLKIRLSRGLRKNPLINAALNLKNKILRR